MVFIDLRGVGTVRDGNMGLTPLTATATQSDALSAGSFVDLTGMSVTLPSNGGKYLIVAHVDVTPNDTGDHWTAMQLVLNGVADTRIASSGVTLGVGGVTGAWVVTAPVANAVCKIQAERDNAIAQSTVAAQTWMVAIRIG